MPSPTTLLALLFLAMPVAAVHADEPARTAPRSIAQEIAMPTEPDYEEEKLRFQRATEPYYGVPFDAMAQAIGVPAARNDDDIHAWLSKAAGETAAKAQVLLGVMSEQGRGTPQDLAQAQRLYERAAKESNDADAQFLLGLMYMQGKRGLIDYDQARAWYLLAAKRSTQAQVNLGWMDDFGRGIAQPDPASAMAWYQQAAKQGDLRAQYNIGTLYLQGKGVKQDLAQARQWLRKTADQGYVPSCYSLGVMAFTAGEQRDVLSAYQWFSVALAADYPGVRYDIGQARAELSADQLEQADAWVQQWRNAHPVVLK